MSLLGSKMDRVKSTWPRRIGKILLWTVVAFLLVRGIGSIISGSRTDKQQGTLDQYIEAAELRESIRFGAAGFAENFMRDYYTFDGIPGGDYKERVNRYLASTLDIRDPLGGVNKTVVASANSTSVVFVSESLLDVDVLLNVRYTPLGDNGVAVPAKEFTMRVPIAYKEGGYAINQLPQFVPTETTASVSKAAGYSGVEVDSDQKEKIKIFLENFLKTYYTSEASELAYYITDDFNESQGIGGVVSFDRILQFLAYHDSGREEYIIETNIITVDNGQSVEQHLALSAVLKEDGKYYMKSISTR